MSEITFYRQMRFDEGLRTGIDVDGIEYWHQYLPAADEGDSGILWFVDIRLEGELLPDDPDDVRRWLRAHAGAITNALRVLSEQYDHGLDADSDPQRKPIAGLPDGVHGEIVLSASRRVEARRLGNVLAEIAEDWPALLSALDQMSRVA